MPKKEKQGIVVSDKMDKTVVVKVASYDPHPKYKKIIESNKNYKAHDAENICNDILSKSFICLFLLIILHYFLYLLLYFENLYLHLEHVHLLLQH